MSNKDFTSDFFQDAWGKDGYYEEFSYGVGITKVCQSALYPFFNQEHTALEIGPGGGTFTKRMVGRFSHLTCLDVIEQPPIFDSFKNTTFIKVPNQNYSCYTIRDSSIDFCFSYNVFCHLSNEALKEYMKNVNRVLRRGANFVFMLSNFEKVRHYFEEEAHNYKPEDNKLLPTGHFHQDENTLRKIISEPYWHIISDSMIPEHRDRIVHLKKS